MEEFIIFINAYGWQITLIALVGIILLGILKYANLFSNIEKGKRKPIYFAISVGFSVVSTIIYLLVIDRFSFEYIITVSTAIYALNQTMYSIYETTTLKDLMAKLLKLIALKIESKKTSGQN